MRFVEIRKLDDEYFAIVRKNNNIYLAKVESLCRTKYGKINEDNMKKLERKIKQNKDHYIMAQEFGSDCDLYRFYIIEK